MAKRYYYAIVTKKNKLVVLEENLPIYWNKEIAESNKNIRCSPTDKVIPIEISDIDKLLQ